MRRSPSPQSPTPARLAAQAYDTGLAICRELAYPRLVRFSGSLSQYFTPPSLGQCLILAVYWTVILILLWSNVILKPSSSLYAYKWEIVGFRGAWVSVTQLPLIYCLGGKNNVISLITGISYERLNWLHRWVARTLFLTIIVHWSFFFTEWSIADFVKLELELMPMVKYGFGAWAVIGWMILSGFGYFRAQAYELFVLQHLASAGILLWLLYVHVPSYARYNIWLAIGFVAFDRGTRFVLSLVRNLHLARWTKAPRSDCLVGFHTLAEAFPHGYIRLTLDNVDFNWNAGQHVFITMPSCGLIESHPFTIASEAPVDGTSPRRIQLYLKCHSGFTQRLLSKIQKSQTPVVRTFISGPWGMPPLLQVEACDSLILMATSTGASFTVPLFEHAVRKSQGVRQVRLYWIIRHPMQLEWFASRINSGLHALRQRQVDATCLVFITKDGASTPSTIRWADNAEMSGGISIEEPGQKDEARDSEKFLPRTSITVERESKHIFEEKSLLTTERATAESSLSIDSERNSFGSPRLRDSSGHHASTLFTIVSGRPQNLDELIRPTIEEAEGETAMIACGSQRFMSQIQNYTAALSDERAVHKGTGAQGIYLFTETYGW